MRAPGRSHTVSRVNTFISAPFVHHRHTKNCLGVIIFPFFLYHNTTTFKLRYRKRQPPSDITPLNKLRFRTRMVRKRNRKETRSGGLWTRTQDNHERTHTPHVHYCLTPDCQWMRRGGHLALSNLSQTLPLAISSSLVSSPYQQTHHRLLAIYPITRYLRVIMPPLVFYFPPFHVSSYPILLPFYLSSSLLSAYVMQVATILHGNYSPLSSLPPPLQHLSELVRGQFSCSLMWLDELFFFFFF